MSYTVRILPRAVADRRSIFEYLVERSPQGALAWEDAYEACLDRLEQNPLQFPIAPEAPHFDFELRQFLRLRGHGQAPVDPDDVGTD